MPFITPENRKKVEAYRNGEEFDTSDWVVGDWCYFYYKPMVDKWKKNPRWTTAHEIYQETRENIKFRNEYNETKKLIVERDGDNWMLEVELELDKNRVTALDLAWQVFFQMYVIPYEQEKKAINGDI